MVEDDGKPGGEATEGCGVPVRTANNWLGSRRVESKVIGGWPLQL